MPPPALWRRQAPIVDTPKADAWNWRSVAGDEDLVLESWSQGFVVGSLLLMSCITLANMRKGILLHKLILLEQLMALSHGTFCFLDFEGYGWYLSSTAALLYFSYILHNVVAWIKVKPFFHGKSTIFKPNFVWWTTRIYLGGLALTVPAILFQITDNFRYFNGYGGWYVAIRPYEPLMRDPWWIFCCGILFYVISKTYGMGVMQIIKKSPRFGILFVSIILACIFTALDVAASIHSFIGGTDGINPFWKISLVFKCLTDAILLDDFKTELKRLGLKRVKRDEKRRESVALTLDDDDEYRMDSDEEAAANYSNGNVNHKTNGFLHRHAASPKGRPKSGGEGADEQVEFMSALQTHPSQLSSDRESRRASSHRHKIGQGGTPATKLPRIFAAIKPGRKSKKSVDEGGSRNSSVWTELEDKENIPEPAPEMQEKKSSWRRKSSTKDVAPDEISYEDDALAQARLEQQRTIAELTRRKNSAATTEPDSTSPNGIDRIREQRKKSASRDVWDGIDDIDEDEDTTSMSHEPIREKNSVAAAPDSASADASVHQIQQQKKESGSHDFQHSLDDMEEDEETASRPSSKHSVSSGPESTPKSGHQITPKPKKKPPRDFWHAFDDMEEDENNTPGPNSHRS